MEIEKLPCLEWPLLLSITYCQLLFVKSFHTIFDNSNLYAVAVVKKLQNSILGLSYGSGKGHRVRGKVGHRAMLKDRLPFLALLDGYLYYCYASSKDLICILFVPRD